MLQASVAYIAMSLISLVLLSLSLWLAVVSFSSSCDAQLAQCTKPSITTASGTHAPNPSKIICPGDLIFKDDFDDFNLKVWNHEQTLGGGGNWEFQWYTNNRSNSYVENGKLFLKPTLVSDDRGENFLYSGTLDINGGTPADECTNPQWWGCSRTGNNVHIVNPVKSARLRSLYSFSFRYGVVEVRAKLPRGDWLWPAIWLLPRDNQYSSWPSSGEIDLVEGRGNAELKDNSGKNIGTGQIASTLHWGPSPSSNFFSQTSFPTHNAKGFDQDFHRFKMVWSDKNFTFYLDDAAYAQVVAPKGGFWNLTDLSGTGVDNPWKGGTDMAPFDQEFYILLNLAVGGVNYFADDANNGNGKKPWLNSSPKGATDFWEGRNQWLPTWDMKSKEPKSAFQIDYVKVWAL